MATSPPAHGALPVSLDDVREAQRALGSAVLRTPLIPAPRFPGVPEGTLYLKLECLQRTGSFKVRGALNRIAHLTPEEAARGVIAASAGNHAQGVAVAAKSHGIPATIVMPRGASPLKISATRAWGAKVVLQGADYDEAHEESVRIAEREHLTYVEPFDDARVIAGQGTVGLEILDELPNVRRVIVGVGGGGLLAGIVAAIAPQRPSVEFVGVQPSGSDTLTSSLRQGRVVVGGRPSTFADGLATRHVGDLPFQILSAVGAKAYAVDDRTIARAVFLLIEQAKVVAEGAGAAPLAGVLEHPEFAADGPTVLVISGGNVDPFLLDRILFLGLAAEGRLLRLHAVLPDAPGRLAEFLAVAARSLANVRHIVHDRESPDRRPGEVSVELELEVRDSAHADEVVRGFQEQGWAVERRPAPTETRTPAPAQG